MHTTSRRSSSSSEEAPPARSTRLLRRRLVVGWAVAGAATVSLAACGNDDGTRDASSSSPDASRSTASGSATTPSPSPTQVATPSVPATPDPTPTTTAGARTSGVYFLVDTRSGVRLSRELRDLPGTDPVEEAVQAMIGGPQDPDYRSTWNPRTKVLSVDATGDLIDVDLSSAARRAQVGSETAQRMVQQLVYTATEAARRPRAKVLLRIAGRPAGDLWGAVSWTSPVARADPAVVRTMVQIDTPRDGSTTGSPVRVSGEANAFEANVPWQVLDGNGKVVKQGFTTAREGMRLSPYSFKVALRPGTYTVRIAEEDPSGGEGGPPMADTKRITIE